MIVVALTSVLIKMFMCVSHVIVKMTVCSVIAVIVSLYSQMLVSVSAQYFKSDSERHSATLHD